MNDRRARAVSDSALVAIKSVLDRSETPEDFLIGVDEMFKDSTNLLALPIDYGTANFMAPDAGGRGQDVNNGPEVYEFLGAQDPANASDPRLWTYLAFGTYREYMARRWPLDPSSNWKGRVEDRWLMRNANRGSLIRHGIARLWWVTSLTYDAKCEYPLAAETGDPFAYTRAAFRNEDRIIGLFDREAGSVRSLVRAVLEHAVKGVPQVTDGQIRALMKEVTLVYGFRDIEALSDQQIRELIKVLVPDRVNGELANRTAVDTAPSVEATL
jgi:hypothetical protein